MDLQKEILKLQLLVSSLESAVTRMVEVCDFDSGGDKYFYDPIFDDQYVYITNDHKALAYNKQTGELVWETPIEGFYRPMRPVLLDKKLYLRAENHHFYCINTENGSIIWYKDNTGYGSFTSPAYNDGKFYYVDGAHLYVVDSKDGSIIFKEEGPYHKIDLDNLEESKREFSSFTGTVPIIDRERGVFYLPDNKRMFCFRLPEEW